MLNSWMLGRPGFLVRPAPLRLGELPAQAWTTPMRIQRDEVLDAATRLLGRPATDTDVVELVVAGRAGEPEWAHRQDPEPWELPLGGPMTGKDPDADAMRLAGESLAAGDPTGWFERLYAESASGEAIVPWDSRSPHALLDGWGSPGSGRALVVGAGLGDDAEYVAGLGYETVAFDVSESAVRLAKERFPGSRVRYEVADLLDPPEEWPQAFDLVVEVMTVQALPEPLHARAIEGVTGFVRPGGTLLVIASGRVEGGPVFAPPWPLTPSEIEAFAKDGMETGKVEDLRDGGGIHRLPEPHRGRRIFRLA